MLTAEGKIEKVVVMRTCYLEFNVSKILRFEDNILSCFVCPFLYCPGIGLYM